MTGRWGNGTRQERLDNAQWEGVNRWRHSPYYANGTLEWHTGVGKTYGAIRAIELFRAKFHADVEDNNIIIVVPSTKLKEDWVKEGGHIDKFNLENVSVYVVNTYVTSYHKCKLLIIDEVHRVLGEDAETFNKTVDLTQTQFKLGLSATLTWEEKEMLVKKGMPVCHTISEVEAREEGFTSDYIEYNLAVRLNRFETEEYKKYSLMFEKNQRYFIANDQFDLKLAFAATKNIDVCKRIAMFRGWDSSLGDKHEDSPNAIKTYANMCIQGMTKRKEILYNSVSKIDAAVRLIRMFPEKLIMTFSMSAEMADAITGVVGEKARSYHTKLKGEVRQVEQGDLFGKPKKTKKIGVDALKRETLELFAVRKITVLNAVKALDEGYDLPQIDMSIITCGASKERQQKQRKGRSTRYDKTNTKKKSIIVNLYCPGTQDEKWLKERQKTAKGVRWIENIGDVRDESSTESEDFDTNSQESY